MLVKKAIRAIMDRKGIGLNALAHRLGKNSQFVSDKLNPAKGLNMSTDKLDELIRAMDYKIVLMPTDVELEDGWFEVDDSRMIEVDSSITSGTGDK